MTSRSASKVAAKSASNSDGSGAWVAIQTALEPAEDRKSTRLNSSHLGISYAVFCLKKKIVRDPNPLHTALERLTDYAEAGADCLYAPGVSNHDEISQIVKSVARKPVKILVSGFNHQ